MARVLIAGCGYVGTELGLRLAAGGDQVQAVRRRGSLLPRELQPVSADLTDAATLQGLAFPFDAAFYTAAAAAAEPPAYEDAYVRGPATLLSVLEERSPDCRVFFTSSTSVYGQSAGQWVDESSPTEPSGFRGEIILEGERLVRASRLAATVLRLGGLYGPGRTRLIESVRTGRAELRAGGPSFTNRIHRDDSARALAHLMSLAAPDPIYLGVDEEPADRNQVLSWLADRLGVPIQSALPIANGERGAKEGPTGKRCSSAKLRATGFKLLYPTYREGYAALLAVMQAES